MVELDGSPAQAPSIDSGPDAAASTATATAGTPGTRVPADADGPAGRVVDASDEAADAGEPDGLVDVALEGGTSASPGPAEAGTAITTDETGERMADLVLATTPPAASHAQIDLPLGDADALPSDIHTDPSDMPSFVRNAQRAERWRRPWVRTALALGCLGASLLLAAQWLFVQRDLLAARSPALKPIFTTACAAFGCEMQAPRALDALRVESSGIARVDKSDRYRLSVALRNLRSHEVALPDLELALTDTQGQLIARRVLRPAELGARVTALGSGAELTLQATLQVGAGLVAGYTIELFYP